MITRFLFMAVCLMLFAVNGAFADYKVYDFENGTIPSEFTTPIDANVGFQISNTAYNSLYGIENIDINDGQIAGIELLNYEIGTGNLSFMIKLGTETDYDFLVFYLNGNEIQRWSGVVDWTNYSVFVDAGIYNITWKYIKDGSVSRNGDTVFLDDIRIPLINTIDGELSQYKLINYTSPIETSSVKTDFEIILNQKASCELYINNKLVYSFDNLLSNIVSIDTPDDFNYYWYCEGYYNNSKVYDKSPIYEITIEKLVNQITFKIEGTDFDVNNESLYIATPCPKKGYSAIGYVVGYQAKYNPDGIYWEKIDENGYATFNLTSGLHNFCVFNGRVVINEKGKTTKYQVVEKKGILELGNFSIPNTNNQLYLLRVDKFEIYDKTDPKAYGTSWSKLASSIVMIIFGSLIVIIGGYAKNGKIVIAGVLLLLAGFGVGLGGIVGILTI